MDAGYATQLAKIASMLGLAEHLDGKALHAHRFRKTIARLIALAIAAGSPKILMDLFDPQDIAMTLHYILSDPSIKAEVEEVAKAQIIIFTEEAITQSEENGGPAANGIKTAVNTEKARLGEEFGEDNLHALAQKLTF